MRQLGCFLALVLLTRAAAALPPVPPGAPAPPGASLTVVEHFRFAALEVGYSEAGRSRHEDVLGELFRVRVEGAGKTFDHGVWAAAARQAGFEVLTASGTVVGRRSAGPTVWLQVSLPYELKLLVERPVPQLTLTPPAGSPETLEKDRDVPYLAALPTMRLKSWRRVDAGAGVEVTVPGGPPSYVGPPYVQLDYADEDGSSFEVQLAYKGALERAGWTVLVSNRGGVTIARYARNGRDVWAKVTGGRGMTLVVCDVGATAEAGRLEAALSRDGHVPLWGIYFDTDKDVIKPESDATLRQVLLLLQKQPSLRLEVQGHTDDQGGHAHNQTLSEARAAAVTRWLTEHGIGTGRLAARGYAETRPADDNRTPAGRAHNRRVELARLPAS